MIYWLGYIFWKFLSWIFYPLRIEGAENLPSRGRGFIIASNHQSYLDPMIIGLCFRRRLSYVARNSLFKNRIFSFFLNGVGAVPIKKKSSDIGAIKEILKRLEAGCPVVIFPEGTRLKGRKGIHSGVGLLAVKSGLPVVPAFIRDSDKVLGPGDKFLRRHSITVIFGPPKSYTKQTSYPDIARQILQEINRLEAVL